MSEETFRRQGAPSSARKEVASLAVIELLANGAGCHVSDPRLDYNCVDTTLVSDEPHRYALPRFDIQAKASSSKSKVRRLKNGDYSFQLEADDYAVLRQPRITPVKFVLMILPRGVDVPRLKSRGGRWSMDGIMLWSDPRDWAPLRPGQKSGTVRLRVEDEFSEEYIRSELKKLGDGGAA
ncbi:DUF4365 domain-containing protein [Streptomyces sp. NPDC102270]|uniref:DUF4365 domain-containing protein n=1 Tax=Streptomyces sp. NPDC102270 TaxID=3366150 RepID=UPI0037FCE30E